MGKVILIGNPVAGEGASKKIERAVDIIKSSGFDVQLMLTEKRGDAESFATQLVRQSAVESRSVKVSKYQSVKDSDAMTLVHSDTKYDSELWVIAAGGDGTFNEVINGLAGTDIPMAILPLGTTNVLAKELNIPEDVDRAVDVALKGKSHKICLGRITLALWSPIAEGEQRGVEGGGRMDNRSFLTTRYFLLMAGIGYDGQTVYGVKSRIKKFSGKGAYVWSGLGTLLTWNPDKLIFNVDGKIYSGYSAIICNASKYAGSFAVAPDARLSEPHLYIFIMLGRKKIDIVRYVAGIMTGRHTRLSDISCLQAKNIEIEGNSHVQIDGDYLGKTPARIEIVPDAVRLIY